MKAQDHYDLWEAHNRKQEAFLKTLPVCEKCGHPIQDENYFYINNEILCQRCMEDMYRLSTEDYG